MGRRKRTVAYIEDEPAVQRLVEFWLTDAGYAVHLAVWLEDAGFDVLLASDGAAGLDLVRAERPDLVVTDALMPVMTGDELVEALQADPDLRDIPIVMATAAASPLRVRRMTQLGCRAVIAKPLEEATFLAAIDAAIAD